MCAKSEYPDNSVDLVTTFHMLLCCVDLIFANVIADNRKDLVNHTFPGIPNNWLGTINTGTNAADAEPSKAHCIMTFLCDHYDGTVIDAMVTKAYTWRSVIKKYIDRNVLKCSGDFLGLLSIDNFEHNLNALKKLYEAHVLSVGEIDEGILLAQIESSALNQSKLFVWSIIVSSHSLCV